MMLSVKEVAAELGLGRDSVLRLIRNDELEAVKMPPMGGKGDNETWRVEPEKLDLFKRKNSNKRGG